MVSSFLSALRQILSNRNMMVLTIADVLFLFGGTLWWPFQSLYILELGASKEVLGILMMFQSVAMLLFQIPGGILADRLGRRRVIVLASFLKCVSPIIYILSDHWLLLIPGILMDSLASIDMPAWNALLADSLPPEVRGGGWGIYSALISIPGIFTAPLGGFLIDVKGVLLGVRLCLVLNEVLLIFYALILWRFIVETRSDQVAEGDESREEGLIQGLKGLPRTVGILILVGGLTSFAVNLSFSFMVVYAVEVIGLTKTEWGFLNSLFRLVSTTLQIPSGFLADRIGRKSCILASHGLSLLSNLVFINSNNFKEALISRLIGGVCSGFGGMVWGTMGGPTWQALIADIVPPEKRGRVMGLIGTMTGALGTPAPWIGGYLYENFYPALPIQLNMAVQASAMVIFLLFLREPKEKER